MLLFQPLRLLRVWLTWHFSRASFPAEKNSQLTLSWKARLRILPEISPSHFVMIFSSRGPRHVRERLPGISNHVALAKCAPPWDTASLRRVEGRQEEKCTWAELLALGEVHRQFCVSPSEGPGSNYRIQSGDRKWTLPHILSCSEQTLKFAINLDTPLVCEKSPGVGGVRLSMHVVLLCCLVWFIEHKRL